jgi:magnesium-transporting ATPase (P-type)
VLRDGAWTRIPLNLLIVGDTITLEGVELIPCALRSSSGIEYQEGDTVVVTERQQVGATRSLTDSYLSFDD